MTFFKDLALNDLANGFLVLGIGIIPSVSQCWPFGESLCQMQVFDQFLQIFDNLKNYNAIKTMSTLLDMMVKLM